MAPDDHIPGLIDPADAPWGSVEMRFAMMSVVMAANAWAAYPHDDPTPTEDLLLRAIELCNAELQRWKEHNDG